MLRMIDVLLLILHYSYIYLLSIYHINNLNKNLIINAIKFKVISVHYCTNFIIIRTIGVNWGGREGATAPLYILYSTKGTLGTFSL